MESQRASQMLIAKDGSLAIFDLLNAKDCNICGKWNHSIDELDCFKMTYEIAVLFIVMLEE